MLPREQVRAHYDRFGAKQDAQAYYEDPATEDLTAQAGLDEARSVFEFGCGTGRFAESLLDRHLPREASYVGVDLSRTMVALARARLGRFGSRATVMFSDGSLPLESSSGAYDRFLSTYVFDLLPDEEIRAVVAEAERILRPGGLLCLVSLTHGYTLQSRLVAGAVALVHALRPVLVGGCRPIQLLDFLAPQYWSVRYQHKVAPYGIPSQVVVAQKK